MKKTIINVMTRDQFLIKLTNPVITAGNNNFDYISLKLDKSWMFNDGTTLKMTFFVNGTNVIEVPVVDTMCQIPSELLQNECTLIFGLIAVKNDVVIKTSNPASYKILPGAKTTGRPLVNWEGFKADLIELLADVYDNALTADASFNDILSVISDGFGELIQAVNNKFNTGLTDSANIADIIFAIGNATDGKSIVSLVNQMLNLRLNVNECTTEEFTNAVYNYTIEMTDYKGFFSSVVRWVNNYNGNNFKDTDKQFGQVLTAVNTVSYYIEQLEYERDLYKAWWEAAVNAPRAEEDQIDFDSFSFDSAEEMQIQFDEISTENEENLQQLRTERDFYKMSWEQDVNDVQTLYAANDLIDFDEIAESAESSEDLIAQLDLIRRRTHKHIRVMKVKVADFDASALSLYDFYTQSGSWEGGTAHLDHYNELFGDVDSGYPHENYVLGKFSKTDDSDYVPDEIDGPGNPDMEGDEE